MRDCYLSFMYRFSITKKLLKTQKALRDAKNEIHALKLLIQERDGALGSIRRELGDTKKELKKNSDCISDMLDRRSDDFRHQYMK